MSSPTKPKTGFARRLRRDSTDAERRLWYHLRSRRFSGFKFRRQHPVGQYFADFACPKHRLIVELDGGQHVRDCERDARRDRELEKHGYRVLRFWDNDVLARTQDVLAAIHDVLSSSPQPSPQRGEGEDTTAGRSSPQRGEGGGREVCRFSIPSPFQGEGKGEGES